MLEMSCGDSSGTESVRKQCYDLEDYPGIHQKILLKVPFNSV